MKKYPPSVYHDPREVVCKHIMAQTYWTIFEKIENAKILDATINNLRIDFVRIFNSQHDLNIIFKRVAYLMSKFLFQLNISADKALVDEISNEIKSTRKRIKQLLIDLSHVYHVEKSQGYVVDGYIEIAGKSMEDYSSNTDYIGACLELIAENNEEVHALARDAWNRGFLVEESLYKEFKSLIAKRESAIDIVIGILLTEEFEQKYNSLQEYEYSIQLTKEENKKRKLKAITEAYYLFGRIMTVFSLMNHNHTILNPEQLKSICPVKAFLNHSGISLKHNQVEVIKQIMLVRTTHGQSPGEFAARVAASVRTTFPKSLISGLIVRTGKSHGGAVSFSMHQQQQYIESNSKESFVKDILQSGDLSGFGHRIHKLKKSPNQGYAEADPRVRFMLKRIRDGFPEKKLIIDELENFALTVHKLKPSLTPNTDFIAGILFHCIEISPESGSGFFVVTRLPGMISEIINQLEYKSNSLRPPLPVILPYTP